eukprot:gnl/TRDRNA2_/TRDRNA2_80446_c0_seq1.p1 gnl/TRDRNA2_/TRDRNA2_80446_c0~~gnl/TRDRNA2_/TRDRNA2_80446_c0_seq1.p1  ORF type:complete len:477 (+),score=97.45 gnl/TRDRNA2_/TRDRNA2_80446_c0_seq1:1-1431(+)
MGLGFVLRHPLRAGRGKSEALAFAAPECIWEEGNFDGDSVARCAEEKSLLPVQDHESSLLVRVLNGCAPPLTDRVDIWGVGVLAYRALVGAPPFAADTDSELLEKIKTDKVLYDHKAFDDMGEDAKDAIEKMLKLTPKLRPSAQDLLRHPWLKLGRDPMPRVKLLQLYRNAYWNLSESQFKKMVFRVIVELLPKNDDHIMCAGRAFRAMDKDRDGLISLAEFMAGWNSCRELYEVVPDPEAIFDAADRNASGNLDLNEWAAITLPKHTARDEANLHRAFRAFDRDGDGVISLENVEETLRLCEGHLASPDQMLELNAAIYTELADAKVRHLTDDSDRMTQRQIDFGEFLYLCRINPGYCRVDSVAQKEVFRLWKLIPPFHYDCYRIPKKVQAEQLKWPEEGPNISASGTWSVYKHHGGRNAPPPEGRKEKERRRRKRKEERERERQRNRIFNCGAVKEEAEGRSSIRTSVAGDAVS